MTKHDRRIVIKTVLLTFSSMFLLFLNNQTALAFSISGQLKSVVETEQDISKNKLHDIKDKRRSTNEHLPNTSDISVQISYMLSHEDGNTQPIELEKHFENGHVTFEGVLSEPTFIEISVRDNDAKPQNIRAVLEPGDEFKFEFIDNPGSKPNKLTAVGTLRSYEAPDQKFSISGDLSTMSIDLSSTIVEVLAWDDDPLTGEMNEFDFGKVKLDEGTFLIEGQIHEPVVAIVVVAVGKAYTEFHAVIEPGAEITVSSRGTLYTLVAASNSGKHAKLFNSWQASEEYLQLADEYDLAWQEFHRNSKTGNEIKEAINAKERANANSSESDGHTDAKSPTSVDDENTNSQQEAIKTPSDINGKKLLHDEGCEHLDIEEVTTNVLTDSHDETIPLHHRLSEQMEQIRIAAMEYVATRAEEPIDALLALEMDAYWGDVKALPIYDGLAKVLDDDLVARRVTHARNRHAQHLESQGVSKSLTRARKAPEFTLVNLEGLNTSLQKLITENQLVLIDFWASWCAPCIASFPELKEVYSKYKNEGFEIASISLDTKRERWKQASIEHKLPWINLGEEQGFEGDVAKSYGVISIPKGFLVDSKGCIVQTSLSSGELKEILSTTFDK